MTTRFKKDIERLSDSQLLDNIVKVEVTPNMSMDRESVEYHTALTFEWEARKEGRR